MDDPFRLWSAQATVDFINKLAARIRSGEEQQQHPGLRFAVHAFGIFWSSL